MKTKNKKSNKESLLFIIAIDVGKKGAITVYDVEKKKFVEKIVYQFLSLLATHEIISDIVQKYRDKDLIFVMGEAFMRCVIVRRHSKFHGVIELIAEKENIPVMYVGDRAARARVLGKGFGNNKKAVQEKYKAETDDLADCMLFSEYFLLLSG